MQTTRQFLQDDQIKFATASGDFNPMHMDPVAARRTQAGAPIVHGMHILLWLLDVIACNNPALQPIATMKIRFVKMIYIGELLEAKITLLDEASLRANVSINGMQAVTIVATFGQAQPQPLMTEELKNAPLLVAPPDPANSSVEDMINCFGKLRLPDLKALAELFPCAARYLGKRRVAALAGSSYLVGMIVPGLHSIYGSLTFNAYEENDSNQCLFFKVASVDSRFRLIRQNMIGGGISAELETFARLPPVQQDSLKNLAALVTPHEFAGTTALIIGGSRGLGELTAKIIVAGGGRVVITYAQGQDDAEKLAAEIRAWGGECKTMAYNILKDPESQIEALSEIPSRIYYFATPPLMPRKSDVFSEERYNAFCDFYVIGLKELIQTILHNYRDDLRVFYPSSVAVDEPPAGMIEYAKAKAVGEKLCVDLMAQTPRLRVLVSRLPRMLTDLTATIQSIETAHSSKVMLPIIREMQG